VKPCGAFQGDPREPHRPPGTTNASDPRAREALAHYDRAIDRLKVGDRCGFGAELDALQPLLEALGARRSDDQK